MMRSACVILFGLVASATALNLRQPELTLPEKDGDKAFKSSADACQACSFFAHQSKSMKEYCTCYSANTAAFGATSGGFKMETTDQDNCALCFEGSGKLYEDQYGDATK